MSFLNSVLSGINSNGKTPITVPPARTPTPGSRTTDKAPPPPTAKRKASGELSRPVEKLQKPSSGIPSRNSSRDTKPPTISNASSKAPAPVRRPGPPPAAALAAAAKPTPKKGSFQEIMARSSAAAQVGQLTHKSEPDQKQRMSTKKELLLAKELAKQNKKGTRGNLVRAGPDGRPVPVLQGRPGLPAKSMSKNAKPVDSESSLKQKPQPSYQGTAKPRPSTSTHVGTARPPSKPQKGREYDSEPDRVRSTPVASGRKRAYSDAGSEEDGSEDGYTYASSDYSEMDAGFDDVDEEEAEAERQAVKEDTWETRRLEVLARQKAQRKKRELAEMERERAMRR